MLKQNSAKFCSFVLKILRGREILTSINGYNSITSKQKMTGKNLNLDHIYINAYIKFGEILSIWSQDIELKQNSNINQGP